MLTELKGMVPICVAYAGEGSLPGGVVSRWDYFMESSLFWRVVVEVLVWGLDVKDEGE